MFRSQSQVQREEQLCEREDSNLHEFYPTGT
jgi:hypothetical protein